MKKTIFGFVCTILMGCAFASCDGTATKTVDGTDSVEVVDSVGADSVVTIDSVDTVAVAVADTQDVA